MKKGGFGPMSSLTPRIGPKMFPRFDTPLLSNSSRITKAPVQPDHRVKKSAQGQTKDGDHSIDDQHASKVIIRLPKLKHLLGVSRSTVYLRLNAKSKYYDPLFPKPIRLGAKAVGWLLADVYAYIDHLRKADEVAI
ncbi:AlpA family phage regulatory protein [Comamonas aquatica]|uniref:helix-turn-helix transcriptional regulator n=2 Tax=Comamonas aquatica TaxID=225991 RepID=UPI00244B6D03|nr:AlpA family phage regulatory protein [Comamonas aquatica]MDH0899892.1 AlpA family phage regulatory protein [Comamonas aquatica]